MARYSDELINRLKEEISVVRLVERFGVTLKKQGADYVGHCPFHDDKTPSLVVSPQKNLWHCLGACGIGGSVIDWVMQSQKVSFRHAVELLKQDDFSCLAAKDEVKVTTTATVPKLDAPVMLHADDQQMLDDVVDYYHQTLKTSPDALGYLDKRGLNDPALIERFKLGHANRTLGLRLPDSNREAGKALREQLQRIGIYRESGHEHFNGSLVVPILSETGAVAELYGRKIQTKLRKGTPLHTYLPGPHRGVFNLDGLRDTEEAILCESLIDALTFWRWGFRHVTTSYGVNGFTDEVLQALTGDSIKRVLIAYDRDEAGNKAAADVAKTLMEQGLDCFRVLFPKGMDANSYACQMQPPRKALGLVLRKAEWLGKGKAPTLTTEAETRPGTQPLPSLAASSEVEAAPEPEPEQAAEPAAPEALPDTEKTAQDRIDTQATPVPALPSSLQESIRCEIKGHEAWFDFAGRVYRVKGWQHRANAALDHLKINLMACNDHGFHTDTLDLYSSKQRQVFINQAHVELAAPDASIKTDLGKILLKLESLLDEDDVDAQAEDAAAGELSGEERAEALDLLHSPNLLDRVLRDFEQAGVVGEDINKLTGYLACTSRQLDRPLAVIIQSSSAAGKSSLMDAILALMPEEERVQYSAMTGQSLFYMGETNLKHKILAISEEEGAHNASYALKLLQSEGEVTIASTGKDDNSGQLVTREYKVEGPVMLFLTTTAIDIDEELLNRCVVLTVNESREQTQAIHQVQRQRRTLEGLRLKQQKQHILKVHHNAQRLLKPLAVINPYADQLTFLDDKTRTRRDHEKYLTLIDSIALLHQYQRDIKHLASPDPDEPGLDYIEVTLDDIATANRLAHEVLGKTLDELPPQTRRLLREIQAMVKAACQREKVQQRDYRFSRKQIRDATGWGNTQLKVHCKRLEDMEYLLVHRGGRGQSFDYELLFDAGVEPGPHLMGLIDPERLKEKGDTPRTKAKPQAKHDYDANRSGSEAEKSGASGDKSGPSRPQVGGVSGSENGRNAPSDVGCTEQQFDFVENAYQGCVTQEASYLHDSAAPSSSSLAAVSAAQREG